MPVMGGIELIARLRKAHPILKVIASSCGAGGALETLLDTALDAAVGNQSGPHPLLAPVQMWQRR